MRASRPFRKFGGAFFLACVFLVQLLLAVVVHLDTAVSHRAIERWASVYLSRELRGQFDVGQLQRLTLSSVWLRNAAIYDEQQRRVLTIERLHVNSPLAGLLRRWFSNQDTATIILESVRADGVHLRLHPDPLGSNPSILTALETDPRKTSEPSEPTKAYRVFLPNVELGRISVDSTYPELVAQNALLRSVTGQLLVTHQGLAASIRSFTFDWSARTSMPIHAFGNLEYRSPARLWGDVNIAFGRIPVSTRVQYQNGELALTAQARRIPPEAVRPMWSDWPLLLPISATLRANGPLHELALEGDFEVGTSRLETTGRAFFGPKARVDFSLVAQNLDVQSLFGPNLPSSLDATGNVRVVLDDDQPKLVFDGEIHPGYLAQVATPRIDVHGQVDSEGLMASGRSRDPNLPVRAAAVWRNRQLDVDAQLDDFDLARIVTQTGVAPRGRGRIRAKARIADESIRAELDAHLRDAAHRAISAARVDVSAEFEGPIDAPRDWGGSIQVDAQRVTSPIARFDRTSLRATGSLARARVDVSAEHQGYAKLAFSSTLSPLKEPQMSSARFELVRGVNTIVLAAGSLGYSDETLIVEDLKLEGNAGFAKGSLRVGASHAVGQLIGRGIDLAVLADLLGLPSRSMSGRADLEIDVDTRQRPAKGFLRVDCERASLGTLSNVSGSLELGLLSDHLMAQALLRSDLIDEIQGEADLELGGSPLHPSSYGNATGTATVDLSRIRLDRIGTLLGLLKEDIGLSGTANLRLAMNRNDLALLPNLTLSAVTDRLRLTLPIGSKRLSLEHKEVLLGAGFDGAARQLKSDLVISQHGVPKASVSFATQQLAVEEWLANPAAIASNWRSQPFEVFASLARQSLSEIGAATGIVLGTGDAELKLWLKGPLHDVHLVAEIQGQRLRLASLDNALDFDAQGLLEYNSGNGEARMLLAAGREKESWLQVNGLGRVRTCRSGALCVDDWEGQIEAGFFGLPIEALPAIGSLGFSGRLRGGLSARRTSGVTRVDGVLPVDGLRMSTHPLGQTLFHVRSNDAGLTAGAKLIDSGAQIDVEASLPVDWRHLFPSRRSDSPIRFTANATGYDAGILQPWLDEYVAELGGELNGSLEATYGSEASSKLALGGNVTLRKGKATLRALGATFEDISLTAQATSTRERTLVSIPHLSASIGEGTNNLAGAAVVEIEGLKLKRLAARIEKADEVPLVANSMTIATLTGNANLEMTPTPAGYDLGVEVGELEVRLPRTNAREVVGLTANPDIVVIQPLGPDAWRKAQARSDSSFNVRLALGRKTRVTRSDFTVRITGFPEVTIGDRVRPSGAVQLEPGGRLQLLGKVFVVERGRVTFDPDEPSNPRFDVTATWRGPTHLVTIHIQGQRERARLRFTSDPPLATESQIMALLLGGSGRGDSSAGAGLGVGATLFNELLSDTALSRLEVRTSSDGRRANYTAAVPIRENLWFEATYQSPTNTNIPGSPTQRGFSGTVDYRFRQNWSVRTEVGTLGAGADLLWQYRY